MDKRRYIMVKCLILSILSVSVGVSARGQVPMNRSAQSVYDAVPPRAAALLRWPDAAILKGSNRLHGDENAQVKEARRNAIDWLFKVFDPTWFPTEENYVNQNLALIKNEVGAIDTARIEWTHGDYTTQVSQTASVLTMRIIRSGNSGADGTWKERGIVKCCG